MQSIEKINSQLQYEMNRHLPNSGDITTVIEGAGMARRDTTDKIVRTLYKPALVLMVQGSKDINVGGENYAYSKNRCLVVGVDIPVVSRITEVPCMTISVDIEKYMVSQIASSVTLPKKAPSNKGIATMDADIEIMDAFLRLAKMFDKKEDAAILAPLVIREIHYRLLMSPLGEHIIRINTQGTQSNQIGEAISWLKSNFKETLYVDKLAGSVNMATSTFHRHFKEITALSPVQYQKRLRLYDAQRLMLTEGLDATGAAYKVGYESFTQFNKEYKRMFGESPRRDVSRLLNVG